MSPEYGVSDLSLTTQGPFRGHGSHLIPRVRSFGSSMTTASVPSRCGHARRGLATSTRRSTENVAWSRRALGSCNSITRRWGPNGYEMALGIKVPTRSGVAFVMLACFTFAILAGLAIPQIRWRVQVVYLHLTGAIKTSTSKIWSRICCPAPSRAWLSWSRSVTHTPSSKILEPPMRTSKQAPLFFRDRCATCHGPMRVADREDHL